MPFLRTLPAKNRAAYWEARRRFGAVYLVRDDAVERLKIGHSSDPTRRLQQLQTGSSGQLRLVAVIAAPIEVERCLHENWSEYHSHLEWFHDPRGDVSQSILRMIKTEPFGEGDVWEIVAGKWVYHDQHPSGLPNWAALQYVPT